MPRAKVSREQIREAQDFQKSWLDPPMSRKVSSKSLGKAHRTMVKSQYGVCTGNVAKLTVVPIGLSTMLEKQDVCDLGGEVLIRRTNLDWPDFGRFKDDTTAIAFIETGEDDDGNTFVECSCPEGLKGTLKIL